MDVDGGATRRVSEVLVPISGRYAVTVVGHYTNVDGLAADGVRTVEWQSDKPAKRWPCAQHFRLAGPQP